MQTLTPAQDTETVEPRWIRAAHWQKVTGMTRHQAYRALRSGKLRGVRVDRTWFIKATELEDYFEREANNAA